MRARLSRPPPAIEPEAREHDVAIELARAASPIPVGADATAIERLLAPLIENGCRYAASEVRVAVRRVDGEVRLSVVDDGPGVDPHVRGRLFDPGAQGAAGTGERSGAGLGLALARRLAQALDGDIEYVDSAPGATCRARLPAV